MSAKSNIEWTDATWSPITGCTPVSEGCKNCYAKRMANRLRGRYGYPADDPFRVTFHPDKLEEPLHWKKPRRVFVCSMGDLFHEDVTVPQICDVWNRIARCSQHTFMILTKRPQNIWLHEAFKLGYLVPLPNVWLGVSVENQRTADERIPILLQIPAAVRFVSVEPMLEWINIEDHLMQCSDCGNKGSVAYVGNVPGSGNDLCHSVCIKGGEGPALDLVICGGESGPGRRPFEFDWARDLRDQCKAADVPFFFKQTDKVRPIPDDLMIREWPR